MRVLCSEKKFLPLFTANLALFVDQTSTRVFHPVLFHEPSQYPPVLSNTIEKTHCLTGITNKLALKKFSLLQIWKIWPKGEVIWISFSNTEQQLIFLLYLIRNLPSGHQFIYQISKSIRKITSMWSSAKTNTLISKKSDIFIKGPWILGSLPKLTKANLWRAPPQHWVNDTTSSKNNPICSNLSIKG